MDNAETMNHKLSIGDTVVCLDARMSLLVEGKTYLIKDINYNLDHVILEHEDGRSYSIDRFRSALAPHLTLGRESLPTERIIHPKYYNSGSIEVWDFIISHNMNFLEGNILKYLCRHKHKNGLEDLKKAKEYLDKLIETESGQKL